MGGEDDEIGQDCSCRLTDSYSFSNKKGILPNETRQCASQWMWRSLRSVREGDRAGPVTVSPKLDMTDGAGRGDTRTLRVLWREDCQRPVQNGCKRRRRRRRTRLSMVSTSPTRSSEPLTRRPGEDMEIFPASFEYGNGRLGSKARLEVGGKGRQDESQAIEKPERIILKSAQVSLVTRVPPIKPCFL